MPKTEYLYPRQAKAMSYRDYLHRQVEEMKSVGAKLEIKEYSGRPPKTLGEDSFNGTDLKNLDLIHVVVKGLGRDGATCAALYITKSFYYKTIKIADRADMDHMLASAHAHLDPIWKYVNAKSAR